MSIKNSSNSKSERFASFETQPYTHHQDHKKSRQEIQRSQSLIRIKNRSQPLKKKKSLGIQSFKANNQFHPDPNQFNKCKNMKDLLFLKNLMEKKEQIDQKKENEINNFVNLNFEYEHYDMVVKDIISEIRFRKVIKKNESLKKNIFLDARKSETIFAKTTHSLERNSDLCYKTMIKKSPSKEKMIFSLTLGDSVYEKKITNFIEFLYKINFSNSIYVDLSLNQPKKKYKIHVGKGNNSGLVKSLLKRRFWLQVSSNSEDHKFEWTQTTNQSLHEFQSIHKQVNQNEQTCEKLFGRKMLSNSDSEILKKIVHKKQIEKVNQTYQRSYLAASSIYQQVQPVKISNHLPQNFIIGSKKILFKLMHWFYKDYEKVDPFLYLPLTYHFVTGQIESPNYKLFLQEQGHKKSKVWIVKPGENTNRGNGISVMTCNEIDKMIKRRQYHKNGQIKTYIVQKYLKPFLYNGRKFDIRHYFLVTSVNGFIKAYWYQEGYIRTSSEKYDLEYLDNELVHLTNDAIQKHGEKYGKYEPGNKISYSTFQRYLSSTHPHKKYDFKVILANMKSIATNMIRAGFQFLDQNRKESNFELFGLDFMIDSHFQTFLIQCNANPCLEISCPLLQRIIPTTIQHTLRLALDPLLPPPEHYPTAARYHLSDRVLQNLKYELIFDEKHQGLEIRERCSKIQKFQINGKNNTPDEDYFDDEGCELSEGFSIQ